MKIASVACTWPPYAGGIGNSAQTISRILQAEHEVANFTPYSVKPWLKYGHGSVLGSLLWRLRGFDYIYLHYPYFGTAEIIWLYKLMFKKTKLIIHYHMDVISLNPIAKILSLPSRLIRNSLLNQADTIITASLDYIKNSEIKNYYTNHPEKFREIPFSIDTNKFQPDKLNRPAANNLIAKAKEIVNFVNSKFIKPNSFHFLFVGGLDAAHYFKGVDILLRAVSELTNSNFELTIVGDGDRRPAYEALAKELNLEKKVKFTGKLSDHDLIRAYQKSDLLILPSINNNEAFGIVLIEAMACGVPVIASDLPGVRSVFTHKKEGLLAKPGSISDLKDKLALFMNNKSLAKEMAKNARLLTENRYSEKAIANRLKALFN